MKYEEEKKFNIKLIFYVAITIYFTLLVISNTTTINYKPTSIIENDKQIVAEEPQQPDISINMAVIGDIMCHGPNFRAAYNAQTNEYDFSTFFTQVKPYISNADVAIGNLETTFAGEGKAYSGFPKFNSPIQLATDIKDMGIDILTTSNNHSMDSGYDGLLNTINVLDNLEIAHTGTFESQEAKDEILIKDINGIKIAFLSYTYGTNGLPIPNGKEYCINLIDKDLIKKHLDAAEALNPDLICVSMHWGVEYKINQNIEQEDLANFLFENGADIILGSHPHVLEPMEKRIIQNKDGTTKEGFLIYSLGNFCSAQKDKYTKDSIVLNLGLTKHSDTGKVTIDSYNYIPIYMQDNGSGVNNRYQIIDLNKQIKEYESGNSNISKDLYNTYIMELKNIINILGE